jgi:Ca-activated chloride channel family protein
LDRITPQNFKTLTYRPKRPLFMVPLGAAVLLLLAFYAAMFGWLALRRLFGRDEAAQPAAAPGTGP